jgi:hypothetical protein
MKNDIKQIQNKKTYKLKIKNQNMFKAKKDLLS